MRFACGNKDVNTRVLRRLNCFPAPIDVTKRSARQATDHRPTYRLCDGLYRLKVALARDRETGLDHIDAETSELFGNFNLLALIERDSRRLFAVTKGRVENDDSVGCCGGIGGAHNGAFRGMWCFSGNKRKQAGERKNLPARGRRRLAGAICGTRLTK